MEIHANYPNPLGYNRTQQINYIQDLQTKILANLSDLENGFSVTIHSDTNTIIISPIGIQDLNIKRYNIYSGIVYFFEEYGRRIKCQNLMEFADKIIANNRENTQDITIQELLKYLTTILETTSTNIDRKQTTSPDSYLDSLSYKQKYILVIFLCLGLLCGIVPGIIGILIIHCIEFIYFVKNYLRKKEMNQQIVQQENSKNSTVD